MFCILFCCPKNKIQIYRTIISPYVLRGFETWPIALMHEQRLRGFENRVLREMRGRKNEDVRGDWRKLHNEYLHGMHFLPDTIGL